MKVSHISLILVFSFIAFTLFTSFGSIGEKQTYTFEKIFDTNSLNLISEPGSLTMVWYDGGQRIFFVAGIPTWYVSDHVSRGATYIGYINLSDKSVYYLSYRQPSILMSDFYIFNKGNSIFAWNSSIPPYWTNAEEPPPIYKEHMTSFIINLENDTVKSMSYNETIDFLKSEFDINPSKYGYTFNMSLQFGVNSYYMVCRENSTTIDDIKDILNDTNKTIILHKTNLGRLSFAGSLVVGTINGAAVSLFNITPNYMGVLGPNTTITPSFVSDPSNNRLYVGSSDGISIIDYTNLETVMTINNSNSNFSGGIIQDLAPELNLLILIDGRNLLLFNLTQLIDMNISTPASLSAIRPYTNDPINITLNITDPAHLMSNLNFNITNLPIDWQYSIKVNGKENFTAENNKNTNISLIVTPKGELLNDGYYNMTLTISVNNTNKSISVPIALFLDVERNVTLEKTNIDEINRNSTTINFTLKNNGNIVEKNISALLSIDNILVQNKTIDGIEVGSYANISFNWTPTLGLHNLRVDIVGKGNVSLLSSQYNISVANIKPMATIGYASSNITKLGEEITLTGQGNDTDGSIVAYQWRTDTTILGTNSTLKISNLSVGKHTIYFKVQDNDGNWSDEVSTTLEITEKENVITDGKKTFIPFASLNVIVLTILVLAVLVDLTRRRK